MKLNSFIPTFQRPILLPTATITLAAGIFIVDTTTDLDIAAAVLYVVVVLMSVSFCDRRGVVLVALACVALTILSGILTTSETTQSGLINTGIGFLALGLTTYLSLKIESAKNTAKRLVEADQLRDALIGSVSHELRTPLASILGGASVLADMPAVSKDQNLASLANGIRDEAVRLNNDIQNLLDAARISSQGLRFQRDWTDSTDILTAAAARIRTRYPTHDIRLDAGSNLPLIYVDPVLVEQALSQIIDNAAKYSPHASPIQITATTEGQSLVISVRDDGAGLTPDEKQKLTERFFRGPRHIGTIAGSGLGMWIANTFIASSAGTLEAWSLGAGQGTTMRIVFSVPQRPEQDEITTPTD